VRCAINFMPTTVKYYNYVISQKDSSVQNHEPDMKLFTLERQTVWILTIMVIMQLGLTVYGLSLLIKTRRCHCLFRLNIKLMSVQRQLCSLLESSVFCITLSLTNEGRHHSCSPRGVDSSVFFVIIQLLSLYS
jgi:hypothetical protein